MIDLDGAVLSRSFKEEKHRLAPCTGHSVPFDGSLASSSMLPSAVVAFVDSGFSLDEKVVVQGQVLHRRKVSKRLCFVDLGEFGSSPPFGLSVCIKAPGDVTDPSWSSQLAAHSELVRSLTVGDIVDATGSLEVDPKSGTITFLLSAVSVLRAWSDDHQSGSFLPCQLPKESIAVSTKVLNALLCDSVVVSPPFAACASAAINTPLLPPAAIDICKHFLNSGNCSKGDGCRFRHTLPEGHGNLGKVKAEWVAERRRSKREAHTQVDDPHSAHDKASKRLRAAVFADWLVATYGKTLLSAGSGILDVGGGRGEVSFELSGKYGLPVTLVDPRESRPTKDMFRRRKKLGATYGQFCHVRTMFPLTGGNAEIQQLFDCASCIVGMHPDEATEPIVQFSCRTGVPCAVIPCCVFASDIPQGTLSYDGFVNHLRSKLTNSPEVGARPEVVNECVVPATMEPLSSAHPYSPTGDSMLHKAVESVISQTTNQSMKLQCLPSYKKPHDVREAYLKFSGRNRVVYWGALDGIPLCENCVDVLSSSTH